MHGTISVNSAETPSIFIVQGTWEQFVTPAEAPWPVDPHSGSGLSESVLDVLAPEPSVADWLRFQSLIASWRDQRSVLSSITEAALLPAYQAIIGMGPDVVPMILAQLESEGAEPDQWFWALQAITGVDPVRPEDRGDFVAMAASWLQWARSEGYAW